MKGRHHDGVSEINSRTEITGGGQQQAGVAGGGRWSLVMRGTEGV